MPNNETETIDTLNRFGVGLRGDRVAMLHPCHGLYTATEAMVLAAWLITMAQLCQDAPDYETVLHAVQRS